MDVSNTIALVTANGKARTQRAKPAAKARRPPPGGARKRAVATAEPTPVAMAPSALLTRMSGAAGSIAGVEPDDGGIKILELLNIADFSAQTRCVVPVGEPLFQPLPMRIEFRDYAPFEATSASLGLRNMDAVPRRIRVTAPDHPNFSVSGPLNAAGRPLQDSRIAPGVEAVFTVTFSPSAPADYSCDLVVSTEREKFVVPLRGYGPQPFLTFPDQLTFDSTAAKTIATRPFMVKNIGRAPCTFSLQAQPPFTVAPTSGHVPVGASMQVSVGFSPPEARPYDGMVEIRYASGAAAAMTLAGEGHDVNLRLSAGMVEAPPTYTNLTSTATITLVNDAEVPVTFSWRSLALPVHEQEERRRLVAELTAMRDDERAELLRSFRETGAEAFAAAASQEEDGSGLRMAGFGGSLLSTAKLAASGAGAESQWEQHRDRAGPRRGGGGEGKEAEDGAWGGLEQDSLEGGSAMGRAGRADDASAAHAGAATAPGAAVGYATAGRAEGPVFGGVARDALAESAALAAAAEAAELAELADDASTDEEGSDAGLGEWAGDARGGAGGGDSRADVLLSGAGARLPLAVRTELDALDRKFRALIKAAEAEPLLFTDGAFAIEPVEGQVWARAEQEFTVTFSPPLAADYAISAFLEVQGRSRRLPLELRAVGLGPRAVFTYDVLDVGDVSVTSVREYELMLVNKGEIPCHWAVREPATQGQGRQFAFLPASGSLDVGQSQPIVVRFSSRVLGEFAEVFEFELEGSRDLLRVEFRGHVVAPTFHADKGCMDFGEVAFAFSYEDTVMLTNTCDVPFRATLQVPDDKPGGKAEFAMEPATFVLEPGERQEVLVRFTPSTVGEYAKALAVDIEDVGESLLSLPVTALCAAPDVAVTSKAIDFGTAFVGHPVVRQLCLRNSSDRAGRYEVLPQDGHAAAVARFHPMPPTGDVPPGAVTAVDVALTMRRVGAAQVPMMVRILGQQGPPTIVELSAVGSGPVIQPNPDAVKFGRALCLRPTAMPVELHNASDIEASVRLFVRGEHSRFALGDRQELTIAPRATETVSIVVEPDDITRLADELCVQVDGGESVRVPLAAVGAGSTMYCDEDLAVVDFGHRYTGVECERVFVMENRGKRAQTLSWLNATLRAKLAEQKKRDRAGPQAAAGAGTGRGRQAGRGPSGRGKEEQEEAAAVFRVEPETALVKPRTAVTFRFKARYGRVAEMAEELQCLSKMQGETKASVIFRCHTKAEFVDPLVLAEPGTVEFRYVWEAPGIGDIPGAAAAGAGPDGAPPPSIGVVSLRNTSPLPVTFAVRCTAPFEAEVPEMTLAEGTVADLRLGFHPGYRGDRQSHTARSNLVLDFLGHGSKLRVPLVGDISFPNVQLDTDRVDFGCVLNDTTKTIRVRLKNPTAAPVEYSWAFEEDDETARAVAVRRGLPFIPVNEAFDIVPIRGRLAPMEAEMADFVFFGHAGRKFAAKAVLEVTGGPEYALDLRGTASSAGYRLDCAGLDFGTLHFEREAEREFFIFNTGKVDLSFSVRTDLVTRKGRVSVSPRRGQVPAGGRARVAVRLRPGTPGPVAETLVVEVGQFDPVELPVAGDADYTQVACSLNREAVPGWAEACAEATRGLRARAAALRTVEAQASQLEQGSAGSVAVASAAIAAAMAATEAAAGAKGQGFVDDDGDDEEEEEQEQERGEGTLLAASLSDAEVASVAPHHSTEAALAPVSEPTVMDVEQEAGRLLFCAFLEDVLATQEEAAAVAGMAPAPADSATAQAAMAGAGTGTARSTARERLSTARSSGSVLGSGDVHATGQRKVPLSERFVVGRFVCDFGAVIRGTMRKRTFRLTNVGTTAASMTADMATAASEGFSFNPSAVTKLPESGSVDVTVSVRPAARRKLGRVEVEVPVTIAGGPAIVVVMRAVVTVPEIQVSPPALDFGPDLLVGQQRTMCVQLHNIAPVPAKWDLAPPVGAPAVVKDAPFFHLEPQAGVLGPGQRCLVRVRFFPRQPRPHAVVLPIRVGNAPKPVQLPLRGAATAVDLRFSPSSVLLPPTAPTSAGGAAGAEAMEALLGAGKASFVDVRVTNAGGVDVEAFVVGLDQQFAAECAVLRRAFAGALPEVEGAAGGELTLSGGMLRMPPRAAGEGLPAELIAAVRRSVAEERAEAAVAAAAGTAAAADGTPRAAELTAAAARNDGGGDGAITDAEAEAAVSVGAQPAMPVADASTPRLQARAVNVVVLAPPEGGGRGVSERIARAFGCACVSLDDAVRWALGGGGGAVLRGKVADALDAAEAVRAAAQAEAEAAADEAAAAAKKSKKKKGAEEPPPVPPAPAPRVLLEPALVAECLAERAKRADCGSGVVVNGLACAYLRDDAQGALVVLGAFPLLHAGDAVARGEPGLDASDALTVEDLAGANGPLYVVDLRMSRDALEARLRRAVQARREAIESASEELPEAEAALEAARAALDEAAAAEGPAGEGKEAEPEETTASGRLEDAAEDGRQAATAERTSSMEAAQARVAALRAALAEAKAEQVAALPVLRAILEEKASEAGEPESAVDLGETGVAEAELMGASEAGGWRGWEGRRHDALDVLDLAERRVRAMLRTRDAATHHAQGVESEAAAETKEQDVDTAGTADGDAGAAQQEAEGGCLVLHVDGDDDVATVTAEALSLLPEPPRDEDPFARDLPIPAPATLALVPPPRVGAAGCASQRFRLEFLAATAEDAPLARDAGGGDGAAAAPAASPRPASEDGAARADATADDGGGGGETTTRRVIRAGESVTARVWFLSPTPGSFSDALRLATAQDPSYVASLAVKATTEVPGIASDPRNVFMRRARDYPAPGAGSIRKRFVLSHGVFEFGPLLAGRAMAITDDIGDVAETEAAADAAAASEEHSEVLRITNSGSSPLSASVSLAGEADGDGFSAQLAASIGPAAAALRRSQPADEAGDSSAESVFRVHPARIEELGPGETAEVRVFAVPSKAGRVSNAVVVAPEGSAKASVFPVQAMGVDAALEVSGEWAPADAAASSGAEDGEAGGRRRVDFGRLLLSRAEDRRIRLSNPSAIAVRWRVDPGCLEGLPPSVRIMPLEGILQPGASAGVALAFESAEAATVDQAIWLQFADERGLATAAAGVGADQDALDAAAAAAAAAAAGGAGDGKDKDKDKKGGKKAASKDKKGKGGSAPSPADAAGGGAMWVGGPRVRRRAFRVCAEAFAASPQLRWEEGAEAGGLDFGEVRVGVSRDRVLWLVNDGKYALRFDMTVPRGAAGQLVTVLLDSDEEAMEAAMAKRAELDAAVAAAAADDATAEVVAAGEAATAELTALLESLPQPGADRLGVAVQPASEQRVRVRWLATDAAAALRAGRGEALSVVVTEAETGERLDTSLVGLRGRAVFARAQVQPPRGLHFGAVRAGTTKERTITVQNDGQFPMTWRLLERGSAADRLAVSAETRRLDDARRGLWRTPVDAEGAGAAAAESGKKGKGKAAGKKDKGKGSTAAAAAAAAAGDAALPEADGAAVTLGSFTAEPGSGNLAPGESTTVRVTFAATGAQQLSAHARVAVEGYDVRTDPQMLDMQYSFAGESSVPGIACRDSDLEAVFEEQELVPSIAAAKADDDEAVAQAAALANKAHEQAGPLRSADGMGNVASLASLADAGASQASLPGAGAPDPAAAGAPSASAGAAGARFGLEERVLDFGRVVLTAHPRGVTERLRLTNPTKIKSTVHLSLVPSEGTGEGIFRLEPAELVIPPHDSRTVEVSFAPKASRDYACAIQAVVEDGEATPELHKLSFTAAGTGTVPTVVVEAPSARHTDGSALLSLGRVLAGHSSEAVVRLRNTGLVPATARFDQPVALAAQPVKDAGGGGDAGPAAEDGHDTRLVWLTLPVAGRSMSLLPGEARSVVVSIAPPREMLPELAGVLHARFCMSVQANPFASETVTVRAELVRRLLAVSRPPAPVESGLGLHASAEVAAALDKSQTAARALVKEVLLAAADGSEAPSGVSEEESAAIAATGSLAEVAEVLAFREVLMAPPPAEGESPAADVPEQALTFSLRNSSRRPMRLWMPAPAGGDVRFSPSVAHLPAGESVNVTASFRPTATRRLQAMPVAVRYLPVTYAAEAAEAFGGTPGYVASGGTGGEGAGGKAADAAAAGKKSKSSTDKSAGKKGKGADKGKGTAAAGADATMAPLESEVDNAPDVPEPRETWSNAREQASLKFVASGMEADAAKEAAAQAAEAAEAERSATGADAVPVITVSLNADAAAGGVAMQVHELPPEPLWAPAPGVDATAAAKCVLLLACAADTPALSASTTRLGFRPTMMFQRRTATLTLTNASKVAVPVAWRLSRAEAAAVPAEASPACPFELNPERLVVPAGGAADVVVAFAPHDAAECRWVAEAAPADSVVAAPAPPGAAPWWPTVELSGRAQRPVAHLDTPESGYLDVRDPSLPGPDGQPGALDASTRVLELESLGVGVRNTLRFLAYNPSDKPWEFQWEPVGVRHSAFRCGVTSGTVLAGRRAEMAFEFTPAEAARAESFWRFSVPSHRLSQLFLVTGAVREPRVTLDRPSIDFRRLLVGARSSTVVHVHNAEAMPFAFAIQGAGDASAAGAAPSAVAVHPASGVIPARSSLPVEVTFAPRAEGPVNLTLRCLVKRKPAPLRLNVKGEGFVIADAVMLEPASGLDDGDDFGAAETVAAGGRGAMVELSPAAPSTLALGVLEVGDSSARRLVIANRGSVPFDYRFELVGGAAGRTGLLPDGKHSAALSGAVDSDGVALTSTRSGRRAVAAVAAVQVAPASGRVAPGGAQSVSVQFGPRDEVLLDGMRLVCVVAGTRSYTLALSGEARRPRIDVTPAALDFGPVFLPAPGMPPRSVTRVLRFTNAESDADAAVECITANSAHLSVGAPALVVAAGDTAELPVTFTPLTDTVYSEALRFEVNGRHPVAVPVTGRGVPLLLDLADPSHRMLRFGGVRVGGAATRRVTIVNTSARTAAFELLDSPPADDAEAAAAGGPSSRGAEGGALVLRGVDWAPRAMRLRPGQRETLEVRFAPAERAEAFEQTLWARLLPEPGEADALALAPQPARGGLGETGRPRGDARPLLRVAGAAQGMSVRLETAGLSFGAVCLGGSTTRRLLVINDGDLPASWRFDAGSVGTGGEFTVRPLSGRVEARSDSAVDVTFRPRALAEEVRLGGVRLDVEDSEPCFVSLLGACVPQPDAQGDLVRFECAVRGEACKTITLPANPGDEPTVLRPVLDSPHWTAPHAVPAKPGESVTVELCYRPTGMTQLKPGEAEPEASASSDAAATAAGAGGLARRPREHTGSLFVSMPDGSGVLWRLAGRAGEPEDEEVITADTPAKQPVTVVVPAKNWGSAPQRLAVHWHVPEGAAIEVRGASAVDVPAGGQREYRLKLVPHTDGEFEVPVTFTAARSGEFSRRTVRIKAGPASVLETVSLEGLVRQTARRTVAVVNPFVDLAGGPKSLTFGEPHCERGDVRVSWVRKPSLTERDGALAIDFRPNAPTAPAPATGTSSASSAAPTSAATSPRSAHAVEEAEVVVVSPELGTFRYQLRLRALPAGASAPMRFRAALGSWQTQSFAFSHYEQAAVAYEATLQGDGAEAFLVGDAAADPVTASAGVAATATISAPAADSWEGVRVTVPVAFVPSAVGKCPAELILRSPAGAEHRVRLVGSGEPPAPAGPFYCAPGTSIQLPFRNPFAQAREFTAASDCPHFTVGTDLGTIGGRDSAAVSVECAEAGEGARVAMGKVVVACASEPGLPPWVFYVRGEVAPPGAEGGAAGATGAKGKAKSKPKAKK